MTMRNVARASAAGLLAAGALGFAATPALAADVDFGVALKGTTIAAGADGKPATLNITNHGTSKPKEVGVRFDASKMDQFKVVLELGECTVEKGVADCLLDESAIPGPGETADLDVQLVKTGAPGADGGVLTITVLVAGDTNKANDSASAKITLEQTAHGPDLRVLALDVTAVDQQGELTGKAIAPGGSSLAWGYIFNHGDYTAAGLKVQVKLPKDVTFAEEEGGCEYTADKRSAVCTTDVLKLVPWDLDSSATKKDSALRVYFAVTVSKDAKGPVSLTGGSWTATALKAEDPAVRKSRSGSAELPAFARELTAEEVAKVEVDATDNTDTFAVLVAGPAGGSGGGDGDDDPTLPVTGPVAASLAGAGAAVLALGAFLLVASRRRRVVLVTPGTEK
jgi:hypothetical protein